MDFKRQHRQQKQREERAQLRMSQSDIQHRQRDYFCKRKVVIVVIVSVVPVVSVVVKTKARQLQT